MRIAMLRVTLSAVICRCAWRWHGGFLLHCSRRRRIPGGISECLLPVFIVVFWNGQESMEIRESPFNFCDQEEDATRKGRLMEAQYLNQSLHERLDPPNIRVVLHGSVE